MYAIVMEAGIPGNKNKPFGLGLCDQYTIKRVAMVQWKLSCLLSMKKCDREMREAFLLNLGIQIIHCLQLAQRALDGDFIAAGGADEYFVIRVQYNVPNILV